MSSRIKSHCEWVNERLGERPGLGVTQCALRVIK